MLVLGGVQNIHHIIGTLPETNIAPEYQWFKDEISFLGWPTFMIQGPC